MNICGFSTNMFYQANFSAFEFDEEVLSNLREYALANSLYWALAEGHACEQSARRNAMDVCYPFIPSPIAHYLLCLSTMLTICRMPPRTLVI